MFSHTWLRPAVIRGLRVLFVNLEHFLFCGKLMFPASLAPLCHSLVICQDSVRPAEGQVVNYRAVLKPLWKLLSPPHLKVAGQLLLLGREWGCTSAPHSAIARPIPPPPKYLRTPKEMFWPKEVFYFEGCFLKIHIPLRRLRQDYWRCYTLRKWRGGYVLGTSRKWQLGWTERIWAGRVHFDDVSWLQIVGKSQRYSFLQSSPHPLWN